MPQSRAPKTGYTEIVQDNQPEIVTALGDGLVTSQRRVSTSFGVAQSTVNKIFKKHKMKPFKHTNVQQLWRQIKRSVSNFAN